MTNLTLSWLLIGVLSLAFAAAGALYVLLIGKRRQEMRLRVYRRD